MNVILRIIKEENNKELKKRNLKKGKLYRQRQQRYGNRNVIYVWKRRKEKRT